MAKPRACVVPCCQGEKFELVHKFPSDRERAEHWKSILNIPDLEELDVDSIRSRYFVCSRHFRNSDYKNKLSRSLNVTANPSLNLFNLCDTEGLCRVVPPMGKPLIFPEQQKEDIQLTYSLDVQRVAPEFVETVEVIPSDDSNVPCVYDPLSADSHRQLQVQERTPEKGAHHPTVGERNVLKRSVDSKTLAGSTPAKLFKFKRQDNEFEDIKIRPVSMEKPVPRTGSIILKKVKIVSPQKTVAVRPTSKKVATASAETQTDGQGSIEQEDENVEQDSEQDQETGVDNKNTTKVLALLECTPENLSKLQRKMKEHASGLLPFDEKLFQEITDEENDQAESAMKPTKGDDHLFLTLKAPEAEEPVRVSYVWLRDHCRCTECYNHDTFQRSLSILDIPDDVSPDSYEVGEKSLNVLWNDGHTSTYQLDLIFNSQYEIHKESLLREHSQPVLWDRELISLCPEYCRVSLNELLCEDAAVKRLVTSLIMYGIAFIEKVPANQQSTEMAIRRVFPIHKTLFGEMWTFSDSMDHNDTAYTKNYIGPHSDNTYFNDASGLQVLHCIQFNGSGGQTIVIDGFKAAEQLKLKKLDVFERLCSYPVTAEYMEDGKHHTYCAPVIKQNIITGEVEQLRFNPYDRAIMKTVPQDQMPQFYADYKQLAAEIHDETMAWQFQLTPGTVMIFDNWRVLHGRMSYNGKRVMSGCYVSRTDYQSVARTLGVIS